MIEFKGTVGPCAIYILYICICAFLVMNYFITVLQYTLVSNVLLSEPLNVTQLGIFGSLIINIYRVQMNWLYFFPRQLLSC